MGVLKEHVTMDEYEKWATYFRMVREEHDKMDWYLASVSHMISAVNGGKSEIEDHLLVFKDPEKETMHDSKNVWLAIFGITE